MTVPAAYAVVYSDKALNHLEAIYRYVSTEVSQPVAEAFVDAIAGQCDALRVFPHRGRPRNDIWAGLRETYYKFRTTIAFRIDEDGLRVIIEGVFYGGQDRASRLLADAESWGEG